MRSKFYIQRVTTGTVYIVDEDGPVSVTNDAENVVEYINKTYPNMRIIYCDTDGHWDELVHRDGVFQAFEPIGTFLREVD